mmetsp:Transcript_19925/g.32725  ORF Transcript_19925/g.32725 Transcript_19925/m.32725 type:complete len:282 (+) Transcript_19925:192-1037(+)
MSRAFTPPDTLTPTDIKTVADVRRSVWINGLFGLGVGSVTGMAGHLVLQTLQRRYVPDEVANNNAAPPSGGVEKSSEKLIAKKSTTTTTSFLYKVLKPLPPLTRNTFLLSFLGGGALGSFVLSSTAGKNAVHLLHPIFNLGRDEYAGLSPYQIEAKKAEREQQQQQSSHVTTTTTNYSSIASSAMEQQDDEQLDIQHHKQRTQHRRASIKERLESGHSLSDTHSTEAHYHPEEDSLQRKRSKAIHRAERWERRQTERRMWVKEKIESGGSLSDSHMTGGRS